MTYSTGDVVRVLTHNPHDSRLLAGDEVMVRRSRLDENDEEVLYVHTDGGDRAIYATDVELVRATYQPAEPDNDVDEAFFNLLATEFEADPEFGALFADASIALGAVDDELSDVLAASAASADRDEADDPTPHDSPGYVAYDFDPDDPAFFRYEDYAGDEAGVGYGERYCHTHQLREAVFIIQSAGGLPVFVPAHKIGQLIAFLQQQSRHAQRPQDEPPTASAGAR